MALGEIGLDLSNQRCPPLEVQINVFKYQVELARELNLPIIIHCRAQNDSDNQFGLNVDKTLQHALVEIEAADIKIHLHCFRRTPERLQSWFDLCPNLYVGFTPNLEHSEVLNVVPSDRLLLETDAPHFIPMGKSGKSKPWYVEENAHQISQFLRMPFEKLLYQTFNNAINFYNLTQF
jgi:TatD DNase family protein